MADVQKTIEMKQKDNSFEIPLSEGDVLSLGINGLVVTDIVVPYSGTLKCYLQGERKPPLTFKQPKMQVPIEKVN